MCAVDDNSVRCHCNSCGRLTDHLKVATRVVEDSDEPDDQGPDYWWVDTYDMLQCKGCRSVCLKQHTIDAAHNDYTSYYPPPVSRRPPTWRWNLPNDMQGLLGEIYIALQGDGRRLALMGARTLVDMLMLEQLGDVGTFQDKLNALKDKGVISERNREVLSVALDAGSAAAHRGYKPKPADLSAVMDIVENLLEATYYLSRVAQNLKKTIPERQRGDEAV